MGLLRLPFKVSIILQHSTETSCNPLSTSTTFFIHPHWPILPPCSAGIKNMKEQWKWECTWLLFPWFCTAGKEDTNGWMVIHITQLHNPDAPNKNKTKQMKRMTQMKLSLHTRNKKGWHFRPTFCSWLVGLWMLHLNLNHTPVAIDLLDCECLNWSLVIHSAVNASQNYVHLGCWKMLLSSPMFLLNSPDY